MEKRDLASELQEAINRLKRSRLFEHAGHLRGAEKHVLFMIAKLNDGKSVTSSEIAAKLNVSMSAVTHQINSLEGQGMITRIHSDKDRRVVSISLSEKGRSEVRALKREFTKRIKLLTGYLGEEDASELIRIIKKISELVQASREGNA